MKGNRKMNQAKTLCKFLSVASLLSAAGLLMTISSTANASGFQLWEQDGASIGNYHAGRAAIAEDASTSFYNPAGLVRIHNQQLVIGLDPIMTNFKYTGTVNVTNNGILSTGPQTTTAQGGNFALVPDLHYAAPISNRVVFGFSVVSPFGLQTDYGRGAYARYAATMTKLTVIDLAPSLGFALTDKLSLGVGLDFERARGEFDLVAGIPYFGIIPGSSASAFDTTSTNVGYSWGYGYHLGALYQFSEQTRIGLSYHSHVVQHLRGSSHFNGRLANGMAGGEQTSGALKANPIFPATTALSIFHTINSSWDVMGSVIYTEWSVFSNLRLQNVAAINGQFHPINNLEVNIPEHYRNTWNLALGANYHVNTQWMLRSGIGYDETPVNNSYRNLQLPDGNRFIIGLGTHFQATKNLGFDAGWDHFFVQQTRIKQLSQDVGSQNTVTDGKVNASADVFGFQMTWDIV